MAVCDFVLIQQRDQLRRWFALFDEGVEAIEARCERQDTIAADLFTAAVNCDTDIRLVRIDEEVVGFMAVYVSVGLLGNRNLFVWMLYLRPGIPDVMAEVVAELDLIAGEAGCGGVNFTTSRPAWQRRLAPHGYRPHTMTFRKEVGHE